MDEKKALKIIMECFIEKKTEIEYISNLDEGAFNSPNPVNNNGNTFFYNSNTLESTTTNYYIFKLCLTGLTFEAINVKKTEVNLQTTQNQNHSGVVKDRCYMKVTKINPAGSVILECDIEIDEDFFNEIRNLSIYTKDDLMDDLGIVQQNIRGVKIKKLL